MHFTLDGMNYLYNNKLILRGLGVFQSVADPEILGKYQALVVQN